MADSLHRQVCGSGHGREARWQSRCRWFTGSGKSTTLAAVVDLINRNRSDHIITIEDPVEFVHASKGCLVHQREVGSHTDSFASVG